MNTFAGLFAVWGVVTIILITLLIYRSRLTKKESDWIPLSDDVKEEQAIEGQTAIEKKTKKLDLPIRALGAVWVIILLVIIGFWCYHGITTPPEAPR